MTTLLYHGERHENGTITVLAGGRELDPAPSQKLWNHSPDGFNWGYRGSGPAQLALALLLDATGSPDVALDHYQRFKEQHVATWDEDVWTISKAEIEAWLALGMTRAG